MSWWSRFWWLSRRGLSLVPHEKYEGLWSVSGREGRVGTGRSPFHALMWHAISNLEMSELHSDPIVRRATKRCRWCTLPWIEHPADNRDPSERTRIGCDGKLFPVGVT